MASRNIQWESFQQQLVRCFPELLTGGDLANSGEPGVGLASSTVLVPRPVTASGMPSGFECQICHEITIDPVVSLCQGKHLYCRGCFEKWVKLRPGAQRFRCCTVCSDEPAFSGILCQDLLKDPLVSRLYESTVVACPKEGCDWLGALNQYRDHGANCVRWTAVQSLREMIDQRDQRLARVMAELEQTRAERDQARNERDELAARLFAKVAACFIGMAPSSSYLASWREAFERTTEIPRMQEESNEAGASDAAAVSGDDGDSDDSESSWDM